MSNIYNLFKITKGTDHGHLEDMRVRWRDNIKMDIKVGGSL